MPHCYRNGEEQHQYKDLYLKGDKETGVTIMKVEKKLDAGPII